MFATFFLLMFAFANFHCQLERGDLYKKHRLTTIYNLRSMKYHGSSLWISLSIFAYHNLIHYSELNLKPISLTNIDSLYPVSMCFIFFCKKINHSDYSGHVLLMRRGLSLDSSIYVESSSLI